LTSVASALDNMTMGLEWKQRALEISSVSRETMTKIAGLFQKKVFEHNEK
jgi:hypothetical protein